MGAEPGLCYLSPGCVASGRLLNFSEPQHPYLYSRTLSDEMKLMRTQLYAQVANIYKKQYGETLTSINHSLSHSPLELLSVQSP